MRFGRCTISETMRIGRFGSGLTATGREAGRRLFAGKLLNSVSQPPLEPIKLQFFSRITIIRNAIIAIIVRPIKNPAT